MERTFFGWLSDSVKPGLEINDFALSGLLINRFWSEFQSDISHWALSGHGWLKYTEETFFFPGARFRHNMAAMPILHLIPAN